MPKFCASIGIVFSFAAVILLVFGEIAQINSNKIPRHLRIISVDTSGLATAMSAAARSAGLSTLTNQTNFGDIYNTNPVGEEYFVKGDGEQKHDGVRKGYEFGLWSYCTTNGDLGAPRSYCLARSIDGPRFRPADILLGDIPEKYSDLLKSVLPENVFTANDYLNDYTRGATYASMVGALAAALTALISLFARRGAFILASLLSIIAFLGLAVGNIIWTVIVNRAKDAINGATANGVDVGITIEYGNALWILWAATGLIFLSIAPLCISCCVGRNDKPRY